MKYLVVNADDYGCSTGINKGIIKACESGIVTSTSLVVYGPSVGGVDELLRHKEMSIGLHFQMSGEGVRGRISRNLIVPRLCERAIEWELKKQLRRFVSLVGRYPDHIDTHHHTHLTCANVWRVVNRFAEKVGIPVRADARYNFVDCFFAWNERGVVDLDRVDYHSMKRVISLLKDGVNELMCHPAICDEELKQTTSYALERQV